MASTYLQVTTNSREVKGKGEVSVEVRMKK